MNVDRSKIEDYDIKDWSFSTDQIISISIDFLGGIPSSFVIFSLRRLIYGCNKIQRYAVASDPIIALAREVKYVYEIEFARANAWKSCRAAN